jgi:hypothetical protein
MAEVDPRYMAARGVLLDALFALAPHGKAVILAGAQAVYMRTGESDLAIAPYTHDADLAINPSLLGEDPKLEDAMRDANFELELRPEGHEEPGIWVKEVVVEGRRDLIPVDLIVPQAAASFAGRRGARLGSHGSRAARKLIGLEAALVDHSPMQISALDPSDRRTAEVEVAGSAALLVAKAHKIHDRTTDERQDRVIDKDAVDVFRIMQTTNPNAVGTTLSTLMSDTTAGAPTRRAMTYMNELFRRRGQVGIQMAVRALERAMDPDTVMVICTSYMTTLREVVSEG